MKTSDKYRFSLQWGVDSEEKIQAGDFLESLGNRKSELVILAVTEYLAAHPEVTQSRHRPKIIVKSNVTEEQLHRLVKALIDERLSNPAFSASELNESVSEKIVNETDIDEMLKNLDIF